MGHLSCMYMFLYIAHAYIEDVKGQRQVFCTSTKSVLNNMNALYIATAWYTKVFLEVSVFISTKMEQTDFAPTIFIQFPPVHTDAFSLKTHIFRCIFLLLFSKVSIFIISYGHVDGVIYAHTPLLNYLIPCAVTVFKLAALLSEQVTSRANQLRSQRSQ